MHISGETVRYELSHLNLHCLPKPVIAFNSFSAKGNIEGFANNADSGESARNELSHLKSALFAF